MSDTIFKYIYVPIIAFFSFEVAWYILFGVSSFSGFWDEILSLYLYLLILMRSGFDIKVPLFFVLFVMFSCFGYWSNDLIGSSFGVAPLLVGVFQDLKPVLFAAAFGTLFYAVPYSNRTQIIRRFGNIFVAIALINFLFQIGDLIGNGADLHGRNLQFRSGIAQPHGIFDHKYKSAFVSLIGFLFAITEISYRRPNIRCVIICFILAISVILSLSVKETSAFGCIIALYIFSRKQLFRYSLGIVASMVLLGIIFHPSSPIRSSFQDRASHFLSSDGAETVRGELYRQAFQIAADYAPLGSGGGTFGSAASYRNTYSPMYHRYGLSDLHGGSEANPAYLSDTFWPRILAEAGWLGFTLVAGIWLRLFAICVQIFWRGPDGSVEYFAIYSFSALFIVSLAAPVYNYPDGAFIFGLSVASLLASQKAYKSKPSKSDNQFSTGELSSFVVANASNS